ncbi:TetR/AcrR family transcriptional regulator [Varunaivibrio sulfuroxidans]|uniref:TetR family transcriptional regulator n=1 Tax=Varunaivibrio sulfuroxidans TaxID=1773489 RepID=A0A4R3J5E9_9PROT|nr:TetR/AcrR family transcriptional regulator [Varunaivibrio sulfuroxidans]TCS60537.1 TetR family transcriptional regulator [Varunaivibrio sulfuroxidans]WES30027.1 TetR/AcrR family transcriptional regulator [Varunaivibrio sulfuroxidans]
MRTVDQKLRDRRRRHILTAAISCFIRDGFHRASMQEICKEAGMSPGNLYRYFDSKEAIIEAIAEDERKENATYYAKLFRAKNFLKSLGKMLGASLKKASDPNYERIALEVAAEASRNPKVAAMFAQNEAETKASLVLALRDAAARGEIDGQLDFEAVATILIAVADGAIGRMSLDPALRTTALMPTMKIMITRFLRPPDGP